MSMVINLVEDHNIYLCEGGPVYNGGVQPTPITYLTHWKIVGNSQVHTDPYLTSWKVSGNSVVDNNTILSCGDLGQDGKYHVKISNGVTIYDIPLTEPLRKVGDVADTIEFPSGTDGKALVTKNLKSVDLGTLKYTKRNDVGEAIFMSNSLLDRKYVSECVGLIADLTQKPSIDGGIQANKLGDKEWCYYYQQHNVGTALYIRLLQYKNYTAEEFASAMIGKEFIYELATPTTELIDVSQFPVSSTDTYTSANNTPYSSFTHTENKEIWSCGEYNATDGKYHILVQPQGGSIADIALDEPLRKVNDVADSIEFPSDTEGKALVTRNLKSADLGDLDWIYRDDVRASIFSVELLDRAFKEDAQVLIPSPYTFIGSVNTIADFKSIAENMDTALFYTINQAFSSRRFFYIYNENYNNVNDFKLAVTGIHMIYELATPTTELVDAPQIEEAESYTCVISQGAKAVSWSRFETDSE